MTTPKKRINIYDEEQMTEALENIATMLEDVNEFHEVVYESNKNRDTLLSWHHNALKFALPILGVLVLFNITLFFILLYKGVL